MKAAVRSFTLAGDLNPGTTGLQSAPVSGKETGDMLTAGEWNRVLELVAQGGGGSGGTGTSGWVDVPLTGSEKFDESCQYRAVLTIKNTSAPWVPYLGTTRVAYMTDVDTDHLVYIPHAGIVSHIDYNSKTIYRVDGNGTNSAYTVDKIEKFCGGGTGGGGTGTSGWVDVPLTDTADFDMACSYRTTLNIANDSISRTWHGSDVIVAEAASVGPKYLAYVKQDAGYFGIRNTHKSVYGQRNGNTGAYTASSTVTVTKIEKNCY